MQQANTRRGISYQANEAHSSSKSNSSNTPLVAVAKAIAQTHHWNAYIPPFRLKTSAEYQANLIVKGHHHFSARVTPISVLSQCSRDLPRFNHEC